MIIKTGLYFSELPEISLPKLFSLETLQFRCTTCFLTAQNAFTIRDSATAILLLFKTIYENFFLFVASIHVQDDDKFRTFF